MTLSLLPPFSIAPDDILVEEVRTAVVPPEPRPSAPDAPEVQVRDLGGGRVGHVVEAWVGDGGRVRFAVVFQGPADPSSVEVARRRLQWFVETYVAVGVLRKMGSGEKIEEETPVRTAFCVDHLPNEVFWAGEETGAVDEVLACRAADLAVELGWPRWDGTADVRVVDLYSGVSDA